MTDGRRPIRQISRNLQEFQAAISEFTDAKAHSTWGDLQVLTPN